MSHEVAAKAFEPFFTTKEIGKGSGSGLSEVFGFVRQLGGHITIETALGRGTVRSPVSAAGGRRRGGDQKVTLEGEA